MYDEPDRRRNRRRPLREQPFSRLFPNLVTIAGLCCGMSAIRFAMDGKWETAVAFIFAAAIIDGMDGRLARMLGATSIFGAQLDSLSDFACFGVAPALVMYQWQLHEIPRYGWAVVLFYVACCCLRLARFNTGLISGTEKSWQKKFFIGVPSPVGGVLCLLPLVLSLQTSQRIPVSAVLCYMLLIGALMPSRIPTFAAKHIHVKPEWILPITVAGAASVVLFISEPWEATIAFSLIYLAAIPFSVWRYRRLSRGAS